jgi:23S rRNA maturation-related 3'-5' exoribonuclease YhaM
MLRKLFPKLNILPIKRRYLTLEILHIIKSDYLYNFIPSSTLKLGGDLHDFGKIREYYTI